MIRRAEQSDIEPLIALVKDCISHMQIKGIEQWPDWYPDRDILSGDILKSNLFIAENEKKIIGMVVLSSEVPDVYNSVIWKLKSGKVNSIHRLAVHPSLKTPDTAKLLVKFVESLAKNRGFHIIRLDTYSKNIAADKFYRKMGYQYTGDIHLKFMPEHYHCFEKAI